MEHLFALCWLQLEDESNIKIKNFVLCENLVVNYRSTKLTRACFFNFSKIKIEPLQPLRPISQKLLSKVVAC